MDKTYLVVVLALMTLHSCRGWWADLGDDAILLRNTARYEIACYVADGLNSGFSYPDTLLPPTLNSYVFRESIKDSAWVYGTRGDIASILAGATQQGIMSLYIFNQEDLNCLGWEEIASKNHYIVRYDLTGRDLRLLKGIIHFPPDESMKDVHMFPAFDELRLSRLSDEDTN